MEEHNIIDYSVYNESMTKSLLDKIFFIDKIDSNVIVDYGCADGTLIKFLNLLFPNYQYIGYDIDTEMIKQAQQNCMCSNVLFTNDWSVISEKCKGNKCTVVLSSVIHEVYSYGTRKDVCDMWKRIYEFDYVVIRDMVPSNSIDKHSDINDIKNLLKKCDSHQLRSFEQIWGTIERNKNMVHFLLKYRYKENWAREVYENYFPITRQELICNIPDNYEIIFHEHFILPFIKRSIQTDFGITIKDNTHLKLILHKL